MATPVRRIVDSSPLILLAKVGQLDLLHAGVPEILVPDTVLSEVGARGPADPVFQQIQSASWRSKLVQSRWRVPWLSSCARSVYSLPMTLPAGPWLLSGSRRSTAPRNRLRGRSTEGPLDWRSDSIQL